MSIAISDSSPGSDPPPTPPTPKTPPKKKGRWRRRMIIAVLVLIAIAVLLRIVIVIALPPVMRNVAARYGLNVGYDRMHLYLMSGDVGFWNLRATPKEGGEPLFVGEYIRANVSAPNLLRGRLVVWRAEVDGSELLLERDEHGKIPLLERFASSAQPKPAETSTSQTSSIDLAPPLQIEALRLSDARAHVIDRAVTPPLDAQLELTLRLSDFGHETKPARLLVDVALDPILDSLRIEGQVDDHRSALDGTFRVVMRGLHPPAAAAYLAQLGLRPAGDNVNLTAQASVNVAPINPPGPHGGSPSPFKASVKLKNVAAIVDGKLAAGLKQMSIDVDSFDESHAKIGKVFLAGVGANVERTAEGGIRAAGFELAPELAAKVPPDALNTAPTTAPSRSFKWELAQLDMSDVSLSFHDGAITPAANLALALNHFTVKDLVDDPTRRDAPATIDGEVTLPGIVRTARLSGSATPFAAHKKAEITLAAEGVKPDALKPYFEALGIESQLKDATASCVIRANGLVDPAGRLVVSSKVTDVQVKDAGTDLLAFNGATINGLMLDPGQNRVRVETIELAGPQLTLRREASGAVATLGLRLKPPTTQAAAKVAPTTQPKVAVAATKPATEPLAKPLKLEIGRFAWKDIKVRLEDQSVSPPSAIDLSDAGIEVANLTIDTAPAPRAPATQPATFKAWLTAPGSAGSVVASGTVVPRPGAASINAQVNGSKMNLAVLTPYLKPLGIEPTLTNGTLELHATADVAQTDAGLTASALVDKLRYLDGAEELAGIDAVKVTNLTLGDEIKLDALEVTKPRAWVQRDADGSFLAGGMRVRFPRPPSEPSPPVIATIGKLEVKDGAVRWTDRAVQPPVNTTARSSVALRGLVVGKPASPARLNLVAAVEGILDGSEVEGMVSLAPGDLEAHLDVSAQGVKQGALASYLPPGLSVTLRDGQFRTRLDAVLRDLENGQGQSADIAVANLDYRDGETSLLKFDAAKLAVPRLDLPRVLTIDEISLAGLETSLASAADGSTQLLGITLSKAAAAAPAENAMPATQPAAAVAAPSTQRIAAPTGAADVARAAAAGKKQLPDVTLKKLDINLKRVTIASPDASPLALADWRVTNRKPIELLGRDPASRPPMEIDVAGKIDPLADAVKVGIVTAPFAQRPSLVVDVTVSGIKGEGALAFAPQLKDQIDAGGLTKGTFRAHAETALKLDRRSLADFDLVKGFDADVVLKGVEFRAEPDGPVLAGVEEVRSEGIRAEPHAGVYHAKAIEITKPIAHAYRDADGIHAMGLVIKLPEKQAEPGEKTEKAEAQPAAAIVEPPAAPAEPMKGEIKVDRFLVSGIDVSVEDRTVQPPLNLPITGLDVDVRDFTTRALVEERPIKFSVIANAGKAPVPRRNANGQYDQRELFSQVVSSGRVSLYPQPKGWAKGAVNGFELGSLESFLKPYGIDLHAGVFDANAELRFPGDGSIDTKSRLIFTDMKLAEPANGPIQRAMKLSAPLDVVLALLQDPSGGITLPIGVTVKDGGLHGVGGAAAGAVASVAATALASAPIKATNSLTGLVGLGPKRQSRAPEPPVVLEFAAADAGLSAEASMRLSALLDRLRRDKNLQVTVQHELGAADVTRAAVLANPSPEAAAALAGRLRQRKNELVELRGQLAEDARVQMASHVEPASTLARLRGVSRDLASSEEALDRLYDLLRPGADRQADRRTRAACIDIGQQRLDGIEATLLTSGIESAKDRVQMTRAQFTENTPAPAGRVLLTVRKVKR